MRRGALAGLAVVVLTLAGVGAGRSLAGASWTLVLTPGATTVFVTTVYTITVTDHSLPNDLGCVDVAVPSNFVIGAVGNPVTSSGRTWIWSQVGNTVVAHAVSGGDRLRNGATMTFTIQAQATQPGSWPWTNHAHRQQDCTGADLAGSPVSVTVAPAPVATPRPTPAVTPAPTPPRPTREPASPSPTPTAMPSDADSPRPSTTPTPRPAAGAPVPTSSPPNHSRMAPLDQETTGEVSLALDTLGLMEGDVMWFVPGAAVGVPGLLVLIWVGLQAVGALAWVPLVRRLGWGAAATRRRRPERSA